MKTLFRWMSCLVWTAMLPLAAAEFSSSLTPEEFAAAGLDRLTPAQLAQLDALVKAQHSGEIARVREETSQKVKAEVVAESKKSESRSLLDRMRVVLTPGTDIEYAVVETAIEGSFRGYEPGKILKLTNGQQWQVIEGSYWAPAKTAGKVRKVIIEPGVFGSFFLRIEDGGRPRVKILGSKN